MSEAHDTFWRFFTDPLWSRYDRYPPDASVLEMTDEEKLEAERRLLPLIQATTVPNLVAVRALGLLGATAALPALRDHLGASPEVRSAAAVACWRCGESMDAITALEDLLFSETLFGRPRYKQLERLEAVRALREITHGAAQALLTRASYDDDAQIGSEARLALLGQSR